MKARRTPTRSASTAFVYRHTHRHDTELVADALERLDIPYYRRNTASSFLIVVPSSHARRAARLVYGLPVSREASPGGWPARATADADTTPWRDLAWMSIV